jgi:hypothetical protein
MGGQPGLTLDHGDAAPGPEHRVGGGQADDPPADHHDVVLIRYCHASIMSGA